LPWQAQPAPRVSRMGYLTPVNETVDAPRFEAVRGALRDLGWIEGQNLVIERRLAEGQAERLPTLAAELAQLQPDVVLTLGEPGARAMQQATDTIPIVFAAHGDPVGTRLVASFAHPGGNVTGVSEMAPELAGKRVELLKLAVPTAARVGAIWNAGDQAMAREYGEALVGAEALGIELQNLGIRAPEDVDGAYQAALDGHLDGVVVILDSLIVRSRDRLVELSTRSRVPTISGDSTFADAGGLMAYGPNIVRQFQRAAYYVDRILKGTKPADLPVEQPMKFELVINLKTAKQIGLTIPLNVLARADKVIR
jgi:putative tryptophan/tyrosine transport system substrate-binding protein